MNCYKNPKLEIYNSHNYYFDFDKNNNIDIKLNGNSFTLLWIWKEINEISKIIDEKNNINNKNEYNIPLYFLYENNLRLNKLKYIDRVIFDKRN